ncbi:MAG: class I SAM-dependent methyltransferase [Patescibacteria group bacterium]
MDKIISENEKTWDMVSDHFVDACSLPIWGPFGVGQDLDLIPDIQGKTFLEVGCGSGRSIKYLIEQGAQKVYGLDISAMQLKEAHNFNKDLVQQGKVQLIKGRMEDPFNIDPVDLVFSIYGIGWTLDPESTFKNICSCLKHGGIFVWSWDHSFFNNVEYKNGEYSITRSYHDETPFTRKNWKKEGATATVVYRKTSTWFRLLKNAGFEVVGYHEPQPRNTRHGSGDPHRHYSIEKAKMIPATCIFVCRK